MLPRPDTGVRRQPPLNVLATLLATIAVALAPTPSELAAQRTRAWAHATNHCLHYTGCRELTLDYYTTGVLCSHWYFHFHTDYYGWLWFDTPECPLS